MTPHFLLYSLLTFVPLCVFATTLFAMLLQLNDNGLHCTAGDFYIDPWRPVERAVIPHAHADHARPGSQRYLTSTDGAAVLRQRLEPGAAIRTLAYGERLSNNGCSGGISRTSPVTARND